MLCCRGWRTECIAQLNDVETEEKTHSGGWCINEFGWWQRRKRKWWILTYCCRNVSVCRVIGIHIGRVMGRGEHSVVVDSESWRQQKNNRKKQWFTSIHTEEETQENSESREMGGTCGTGMRQSDAELSAQCRKTPHIMLRSIPDPSTTLITSNIKPCTDNITANVFKNQTIKTYHNVISSNLNGTKLCMKNKGKSFSFQMMPHFKKHADEKLDKSFSANVKYVFFVFCKSTYWTWRSLICKVGKQTGNILQDGKTLSGD